MFWDIFILRTDRNTSPFTLRAQKSKTNAFLTIYFQSFTILPFPIVFLFCEIYNKIQQQQQEKKKNGSSSSFSGNWIEKTTISIEIMY